MLKKQLTPQQENEISRIKEQWLNEAEPYLSNPPDHEVKLDGSDSKVLAQIQQKYKRMIQEVVENK